MLVIFQSRWFALYFTTQVWYSRGKYECQLMLFAVITQNHVWLWKNSKVLKKYQHVTSNHNTDQSRTQKPNKKIKKNKVLKTKPNSHVTGKRHRSKKKKKKKKTSQFWKERLFSKTFFTSVLTIASDMPKTKSKNPGKMFELIYLKI